MLGRTPHTIRHFYRDESTWFDNVFLLPFELAEMFFPFVKTLRWLYIYLARDLCIVWCVRAMSTFAFCFLSWVCVCAYTVHHICFFCSACFFVCVCVCIFFAHSSFAVGIWFGRKIWLIILYRESAQQRQQQQKTKMTIWLIWRPKIKNEKKRK